MVFGFIGFGPSYPLLEAKSPLDRNLIAHYSFDHESIDNSGNDNDGVDVNGPEFVDGVSGKAKKFNGSNSEYVALHLMYGTRAVLSEFSVPFWTNNAKNGVIFSIEKYSYFEIRINEGMIEFETVDSSGNRDTLSSHTKVNTKDDFYVDCKYSSVKKAKQIVINNEVDAESSPHEGKAIGTGKNAYAFIGVGSLSYRFNDIVDGNYLTADMLDEVRFYNVFLPQEADLSLYNSPGGPSSNEQSSLYASIYDKSSTIYDDIMQSKLRSLLSELGFDALQYDVFSDLSKVDSTVKADIETGPSGKATIDYGKYIPNTLWSVSPTGASINGVTVDSDGNVYTASSAGVVEKYDKDGNFVWSKTINVDATLRYIELDSQGNIYVANDDALASGHSIYKVSKNGSSIIWSKDIGTSGHRVVAVSEDGYLYSSNYGGMIKFDLNGSQIRQVNVLNGACFDIDIDKEGYIYTGDESRITKFDSYLNIVWQISPYDSLVRGVGVDDNGYLMCGDNSGRLFRIDPSGVVQWTKTDVFDSCEHVYVNKMTGAAYAGGEVDGLKRFNTDGSLVYSAGGDIRHIDIDEDAGYIYTNEIRKIEEQVGYPSLAQFTSIQKNIGFLPVEVYVVQDADIPFNTDIVYNIYDNNDNYITITQSDLDVAKELDFDNGNVHVEVKLITQNKDLTPELNYYALLYKRFDTLRCGNKSDRPSSSLACRIFHAFDEDQSYLDTGSSWKEFEAISINRILDIYDSYYNALSSLKGYNYTFFDIFHDEGKISSKSNAVVDTGKDGIAHLSKYVTTSEDWTKSVDKIKSMTKDNSNNVVIGDWTGTVTVYDSTGNSVLSFSKHSSDVSAIAIDSDGNYYTASSDSTANKVDSSGNLVWSVTSSRHCKHAIGVDSSGNVYIGETATNTIYKYDKDGNYLDSLGNGAFSLVVDHNDNVIAGDYSGNLEKFDNVGTSQWTYSLGSECCAIDVDSNNNIYTGDHGHFRKFAPDGTLEWSNGYSDMSADFYVNGVSVGSNDDIVITVTDKDDDEGDVYRYTPSNSQVWSHSYSDELGPVAYMSTNSEVYFATLINNEYLVKLTETELYNVSGNIQSTSESIGFTPISAYIDQDADIPADEDIQYVISDNSGNSKTITQSDVGTDISLPFEDDQIDVQINLSSSDGDDTPTLYKYAVFFNKPYRTRTVKRNATGAVVFASAGDSRGTSWTATTATNPTHTLSFTSTPMNFAKGKAVFQNTVTGGTATLILQTTGGSALTSNAITNPTTGQSITVITSNIQLTNIQCVLQCSATTGTFTSLTQYLLLNEETTHTFN